MKYVNKVFVRHWEDNFSDNPYIWGEEWHDAVVGEELCSPMNYAVKIVERTEDTLTVAQGSQSYTVRKGEKLLFDFWTDDPIGDGTCFRFFVEIDWSKEYIMKVGKNRELKAITLESGFGGSGGTNTSGETPVHRHVFSALDLDKLFSFEFYPYYFGDEYGNYSGTKIVFLSACEDEVHFKIDNREYAFSKDKPGFYNRLPGISYDTHGYYYLSAHYHDKTDEWEKEYLSYTNDELVAKSREIYNDKARRNETYFLDELLFKRGDERAYSFLGDDYKAGRGVPQSEELAVYFYEMGAKKGNVRSLMRWAELLLDKEDFKGALSKYMQALRFAKSEEKRFEIFEWLASTALVTEGYEKLAAYYLFQIPAEKRSAMAWYALGLAYFNAEEGYYVQRNLENAAYCYMQAQELAKGVDEELFLYAQGAVSVEEYAGVIPEFPHSPFEDEALLADAEALASSL